MSRTGFLLAAFAVVSLAAAAAADGQGRRRPMTPLEPLKGAINGNKPIMCSIMAVSEGVFFTGTIHTDGHGYAAQHFQFDKSTQGTIINPERTWVWSATHGIPGGGRNGMSMPTRPGAGESMQFKSGDRILQGIRVRQECKPWTVDRSVFRPPSNIRFMHR